MGKYALGFVVWVGLLLLILKWTGWGYSDPAYWGLLILGTPVSMLVASVTLDRTNKKE